jgi:outer membrane biosynthesis protein TonB
MTSFKRIFLVALLGAGLATVGCGGDDEGAPIPAQTAQALQTELDGVQARLDNGSAGACNDILEGERGPNLERVQQLLDGLPDDVDPDVRSALEDSFNRLWELVQEDCDEKAQEEESQQEEPEPEPEPTPTETEPEPEPTPTETEPEPVPTTPEETPLPPEGDGNNGGAVPGEGNGGGVGPGAAKEKKAK